MFDKIIGSAAGALLGGITGSKGQKSTQSTAPVLPENVKKAYDTLIDRSVNLSAEPYRDVVRTRAEPNSMYGGLFNNPEMMALQQASDTKYFQNMNAPKAQPAAPPPQMAQPFQSLMMRNMFEQPNIMNGQFSPQETGLDDDAYSEMASQYASGQFKPSKNQGRYFLDGNNPFIQKLLEDSKRRAGGY